MKKSLLALAVLGAFAGAASAQSSVTVYGLVEVQAQKAIGTKDKAIADSVTGSRLGFRGVEDLGGGLKATFGMEHRLNPATGTSTSANFWNGYSKVGVAGDFGHIELGRDYTVNFLMVQNQIDPFAGDTVAILRNVGMIANLVGNGGSVRYSNQIEYHMSANGFNFGAQIAEGVAANGGTANKAYSLAANYAAGPLFVAAGMENGGGAKDKMWDIGARYNLGVATLTGGYSNGVSQTGVKQKGALIGAIIPAGPGNVKVGLARSSNNTSNKFGLGYDYLLSKRTKVYADIARDSKVATEKTGYDLGIAHSF